jgi:hypothetical protein
MSSQVMADVRENYHSMIQLGCMLTCPISACTRLPGFDSDRNLAGQSLAARQSNTLLRHFAAESDFVADYLRGAHLGRSSVPPQTRAFNERGAIDLARANKAANSGGQGSQHMCLSPFIRVFPSTARCQGGVNLT